MKRKLIINILTLLILLWLGQTIVNATDDNVSFTPSKEDVKQGEEFNLIVSASSDNGLSGLSAIVEYDQNVLEVVNSGIIDNTNWADFDTFPNIVVLWKTALSNSKSADIYKITFKVKEGIANASTDIKLKNIIFSPATGNEVSKSDITKNIKITANTSKNEETKQENNQEEAKSNDAKSEQSSASQEPTGQQANSQESTSVATPSQESSATQSSSQNNSSKQTNSQTQVAATSSKKAASTGSTTNNVNENLANKTLPYSGKVSNILLVIVAIIAVIGIVSYKIYNKYRGI